MKTAPAILASILLLGGSIAAADESGQPERADAIGARSVTPPVLIQYEELKVIVPVYPGVGVDDPAAFVAISACRYLRLQKIPLPIEYELVFYHSNGAGAVIQDNAKPNVTGTLTRCD